MNQLLRRFVTGFSRASGVAIGLTLIAFAAGVVGVLLFLDARPDDGFDMILLCFAARVVQIRYSRPAEPDTSPTS